MGRLKRFEAPDINMVERLTAQLIDSNRSLEEANANLRRSEAARVEMLANISHDLRAPLTAVRSALDYLNRADGADDGAQARAALAILDRRVAALEHLVGELYYSISMEQPGFALKTESMPVAVFLEEWFSGWELDERCGGRNLLLSVPAGFEPQADIDPERMARVLDNLMENALRFTQEGDTLELGCGAPEEGAVEFYLRDTGAGIPEQDLPRIFERTYTASAARTPDERSGSGLGLHIARAIVEKHGGLIRCESAQGKGSVFKITLPCSPFNEADEKQGGKIG
jgi:two-component system phosphate regulon sensor histidine kinase PhoR/two-component system sensor histidine kinase VicK